MRKVIKASEMMFAVGAFMVLAGVLAEAFCQVMIIAKEGEFIGWGFTTWISISTTMTIAIAIAIVAMAAIFAVVMVIACLLSWACERRNATLERFFEKVARYAVDCLWTFWPSNW